MRDDIPYRVTLDRRDLFDFVRGAIKDVLNDYAVMEAASESWAWNEAHDRTVAVFLKLKLPGPDEDLLVRRDPGEIRKRCEALGMPKSVIDSLIATNCSK